MTEEVSKEFELKNIKKRSLKFRLKNIEKIRNYFVKEIAQNELLCNKNKKAF